FLRTVQPAQGKPSAARGVDGAPPPAGPAGTGALHPALDADDPERLAAVPRGIRRSRRLATQSFDGAGAEPIHEGAASRSQVADCNVRVLAIEFGSAHWTGGARTVLMVAAVVLVTGPSGADE